MAFAHAVGRFVSLAQKPPSDGQCYAEELYRAVLALFRTVVALPPVCAQDDSDELGFDVSDDEWLRVYTGCKHLPGDSYYDFTWPDGRNTTGDVADDVADIYRDLKPGLSSWNTGREELAVEAIWHWRFLHEHHWGQHLSGLRKGLQPMVRKAGYSGVALATGEETFLREILKRRPAWEDCITRTPSEETDTWTAVLTVESPTGDASRNLVLWLQGESPSIRFGSNWHDHLQSMDELWAYVEAIQNDELALAVDIGGEHDGFEDLVDLREEEALLELVTSKHSAPRTRIKSFGGTRDCEYP